LYVADASPTHVCLLNKFNVVDHHLLIVTRAFEEQETPLTRRDFEALWTCLAEYAGLGFYNSGVVAGASQPHRHLQLLPRSQGEPSCPLAPSIEAQLAGEAPAWPWAYRLSRRQDPHCPLELAALYGRHCRDLDLGQPALTPAPAHAYNLVFNDHWLMTVRRVREHQAGFSINGLGFAGYLLSTARSERDWLAGHGPWALLQAVAAEHSVVPRLRCIDG
jgi:ATP adenylyltransferase